MGKYFSSHVRPRRAAAVLGAPVWRPALISVVLVAALSCRNDKRTNSQPGFAPPGAVAFPAQVTRDISAAIAALPADYVPRTRHKKPDGSALYANRLLLEKSPYLLQHAHNPVNWFPWGEEAFELAKKLGRPVLLSVGYSTCHWCHVMEEESFEDPEIAKYINENYVAIKVDREQRPDIDSIYMKAVQRLTGSGGWPMNVWLTPDKRPFFGGTYFPPRAGVRGRNLGFIEVLTRAKSKFDEDPAKVAEVADSLVSAMSAQDSSAAAGGAAAVNDAVLIAAAQHYAGVFDPLDGGVKGRRTKFPSSFPIRFLLRYSRRSQNPTFAEMAAKTLLIMAQGGIYDHIGGGFHRYSTDPKWAVPHFEKMLYDNALLVVAYLEGYQATGDLFFRDVAFDVLAYLNREMRAPEGGFYSATDADSAGPDGKKEEGLFFTWTPQEIDAALKPKQASIAKALYGVRPGGNYEGRTVLAVSQSIEEVAQAVGQSPEEVVGQIREIRDLLYGIRSARAAPARDEKVLAAWNGLAISAFARAARVAHDSPQAPKFDHLAVAEKAAEFVLTKMSDQGRISRSYLSGRGATGGFLEDYAFVIQGLLDLFEASHKTRYLTEALRLEQIVHNEFADPAGGYFHTSSGHEALLLREKPAEDGAIPSGNSVHALNLQRLYALTADEKYLQRCQSVFAAFSGVLTTRPDVMSEMLLAIDFATDTAREVVVVLPDAAADGATAFDKVLATEFVPNHVYVRVADKAVAEMAKVVPPATGKLALKAQPTAYVCEQSRCQLPTADAAVFAKQLAMVKLLAGPPAPPK